MRARTARRDYEVLFKGMKAKQLAGQVCFRFGKHDPFFWTFSHRSPAANLTLPRFRLPLFFFAALEMWTERAATSMGFLNMGSFCCAGGGRVGGALPSTRAVPALSFWYLALPRRPFSFSLSRLAVVRFESLLSVEDVLLHRNVANTRVMPSPACTRLASEPTRLIPRVLRDNDDASTG